MFLKQSTNQNRLGKVLHLLHKEMEVVDVQKKIQHQIGEKIDKQQKEFFLREQLKAIKIELGLEKRMKKALKSKRCGKSSTSLSLKVKFMIR